MRLLFAGTPGFAVPSLERLAAEHEVVAVLTQPPRPRGRGRRLAEPPVAAAARSLGLAVMQPERLEAGLRARLLELEPDAGVVVAYGLILPGWLIGLPRLGFYNAHASLLPRYRGPAPIPWAIIAGERETGVTVQRVVRRVDAGDILLQERVVIGEMETAGELAARLSVLSAELLSRAMRQVEAGTATFTRQDEALATYAPKLEPAMAWLDFSRPARELARLVCGLNPWPCARTRICTDPERPRLGVATGPVVRLLRARAAEGVPGRTCKPGEVLGVDGEALLVACGGGGGEGERSILACYQMQREGRSPVSGRAFASGLAGGCAG